MPVLRRVNVALRGSSHDQLIITNGHIDHSIFKLQVFHHFIYYICHCDFVILGKHDLDILPREGAFHNMSEYDGPVASSPRHHRAVITPVEFHERPTLGSVNGVSPPCLITQLQHFITAHGS